TDKELVGNLATETLLGWCDDHNIETGLNREQLLKVQQYPLLSNL
ncbi:MAG: hypothetical protein GXO86_05605, partial [Chlorobi bacterium]|nr:hypothetical protein [Chlorobiota bacterium]